MGIFFLKKVLQHILVSPAECHHCSFPRQPWWSHSPLLSNSWSCQLRWKMLGILEHCVSFMSSPPPRLSWKNYLSPFSKSIIHSYSSSPGSSASSSSSVCSGTRFWPVSLSNLRVLPPPGAGPWSGTCCRETLSPAPGSGVWCTDTFSSGWTWHGSN